MAKSIKPKKVKKIIEEPKAELPTEPIVEIPEIGDEPPSVTLDEVKEVEVIHIEPEPVVEFKGVVYPANEDYKKAKDFAMGNEPELSMEQKILNFIDSRGTGKIILNDFLKSLFGVPKLNEPHVYLRQGSSRMLRATLIKLQSEGKINIENNRHMRLGQSYYSNNEPETKYYNLNTVQLVAVK